MGGSCVCHCGPVVLATVLAMMIVLFNEFGGVVVPCASLSGHVAPVLLCTVIECMLWLSITFYLRQCLWWFVSEISKSNWLVTVTV